MNNANLSNRTEITDRGSPVPPERLPGSVATSQLLEELNWIPRPKLLALRRLGIETVEDLLTHFPRRHVGELTPETAQQLDLPANVQGVMVNGVDPDSGIAELRKGDVIEEVNQQPVTSVADYNKIVAALDPSKPQVLSVCRGRMRSFLVLRPR